MTNEITLPSGRKIGPGHAPYIVAEIGSNWRTLEDCMTSISQAKACGADAVKFQLFDWRSLYGVEAKKSGSLAGIVPLTHDEDERIKEVSLPKDWIPKLAEKCKATGIDFMCTAFSPELYDVVNPYVDMHKVASAEATHVRILEKLRSYGKPVILSTGAKGAGDIGAALNILGHSGGGYLAPPEQFPTPVILMYCVAAYPAKEVNIDCIGLLASKFGCAVGYSDHSTDILAIPRLAVHGGAVVLEKHFTAIEADTPDRGHSLNADEFQQMVRSIRGEVRPSIGWVPGEHGMILRHNRRLIATRDIPAGEVLRETVNFGIFRSLKDDTKALSPFMVDQVNGRIAKGPIKAGEGIGPGDFE